MVLGQRILLYLYLYQLYYKSLCGRRQVAEPPKICVLYLFVLNQFLLCFIIQSVSNGLRIIMAKVLFAVLLLSHFMFLHLENVNFTSIG